jgi:hypothetical protein
MRRRRFLILAGLLASTALAVGAAGPAAAGEGLTKSAFRKEANTLCKIAYDAIAEVFENTFAGATPSVDLPPEQIAAAANGAVLLFRGMLDRVEALDGPAAYERKVDRMLDQYRVVAADIEDDPQIIFDEGGIFGKPDKVAARLGLRGCVQEPSRLRD